MDELDEIVLSVIKEWNESMMLGRKEVDAVASIGETAKQRLNALIEKKVREARINGEIAGLATFAQRDRKSFRVNSSIMSIDSKDILLDIADCYERLAQLQENQAKEGNNG
jgi:hypothetical protein